MIAQVLLLEPSVGDTSRVVDRRYRGRAKLVGDISRAVDRTCKGREKFVGDS